FSAVASSTPDKCASLAIHAFNTASSGLFCLIRSPAVCGIRAVGFRSKSDASKFCRSTKTTSEFPKAVILSASASASGKCSRVGLGKRHPVRRGHAMGVVAGTAVRLLENREKGGPKIAPLPPQSPTRQNQQNHPVKHENSPSAPAVSSAAPLVPVE